MHLVLSPPLRGERAYDLQAIFIITNCAIRSIGYGEGLFRARLELVDMDQVGFANSDSGFVLTVINHAKVRDRHDQYTIRVPRTQS
jgi:hypothetical protein